VAAGRDSNPFGTEISCEITGGGPMGGASDLSEEPAMTISIGTSTPSTVRDTHAAWLRRREDSRPYPWTQVAGAEEREERATRAEAAG
jgi:hypothetical protein